MADGTLFGRTAGPIFTDVFCGGGGASLGMSWAFGVSPAVALNHCAPAIEMHRVNHPETEHHLASVFDVSPLTATRGRAVDLAWFSPDCTDHSRAKAGKPRDSGRRALAWVVVDWARSVRPRVIALENVEEFAGWGPLYPEDHPDPKLRSRRIPERAGEFFREWVQALEEAGYVVEWRLLRCADYGIPTTRRRLYLVARRDGRPIVWPEPTHAKADWIPGYTCVDWGVPTRSIFGRSRPLADATLARIAHGVKKYVLDDAAPFLVNLSHGGRLEPLTEPIRTITAKPRGGDRALVVPFFANTRNGERAGQAPRVRDLRQPLPTVTAEGSQGALVSAFLTKFYGTSRAGSALTEPIPTVTAGGGRGGGHVALTSANFARESNAGAVRCAAFLMRYFGSGGQWSDLRDPVPTVTARENLALVTTTIAGEEWVLTDIGMRMLIPRELARAQGFPDGYLLTGNVGEQIERIGNSVAPHMAEVIARSNLPELCVSR